VLLVVFLLEEGEFLHEFIKSKHVQGGDRHIVEGVVEFIESQTQ
jgi:hypothetical protein